MNNLLLLILLACFGVLVTSSCTGTSINLTVGECDAWQMLYDSMGGSHWRKCSGLRNDPCACSYDNDGYAFKIDCFSSLGVVHIKNIHICDNSCDNSHNITKCELDPACCSSVKGIIPDAISGFTELEHLVLNNNVNLTGIIPESLSKLKKLKGLDVDSNTLYGSIPSFNFSQFIYGCEFLGNNAAMGRSGPALSGFDCPLPPGAENCRCCGGIVGAKCACCPDPSDHTDPTPQYPGGICRGQLQCAPGTTCKKDKNTGKNACLPIESQ